MKHVPDAYAVRCAIGKRVVLGRQTVMRKSGWMSEVRQMKTEGITNLHISIAIRDDCKNLAESYGEICVLCNKCGRFDKGGEDE